MHDPPTNPRTDMLREISAHPLRVTTIMVLAFMSFVAAYATGQATTLDVPATVHGTPYTPDVRLMPHPSSPVARPATSRAAPPPERETAAEPSTPVAETTTVPPERTTEPASTKPVSSPAESPPATAPTSDPPASSPPGTDPTPDPPVTENER